MDDHDQKDKWEGHRVHGAGVHSSQASIVTRDSSHTVVVVVTTESDFAIQLPVTSLSTDTLAAVSTDPALVAVSTGSTTPVPVAATLAGDLVDVCIDPASVRAAYVWYGATVADSMTGHYETIDPGMCRTYRYVSGAVWNRYT